MVYSQQDPSKTYLTGKWLVAVYLFSNDQNFVEEANLGKMVARWPKNKSEAQNTTIQAEVFALLPNRPIWRRALVCDATLADLNTVVAVTMRPDRYYGSSNEAAIGKLPDLSLRGMMRIHRFDSRDTVKEKDSEMKVNEDGGCTLALPPWMGSGYRG